MATFPVNEKELLGEARKLANVDKYGWRLPWSLLLLVVLSLVLEWFYSPFELVIGKFMDWSRTTRPQIGRGWELNREGAEAVRRLGQIGEKIDQRRVAGSTLEDWSQVPEMLKQYEAFSVSPKRFLSLYGLLPPRLQEQLMDPVEILRIHTDGRWQRVFFVSEESMTRFYLVDPYNVVLAQGTMSESFFRRWDELNRPVTATLDELEPFIGRIFPASLFFEVVAPSGPVKISDLDARWISGLEGRLTRVGIAASAEGNLRAVGFELERNSKNFVHRIWVGDEEALELFREMSDRSLFGEEDL